MLKEQLHDFLFFGNGPEEVKTMESLLKVLADKDTAYLIDLDGIIANSPQYMVKQLNLEILGMNDGNNRRNKKYRVIEFDRFEMIKFWAIENGMFEAKAQQSENRWYEPGPLLASNPYLLAIPLMNRLIKFVGPDKVKTLTARKPHLTESTLKWRKRWISNMPEENVLIRSDESIGQVEFKVQKAIEEARKQKFVVVVDDSGTNIRAILEEADRLGIQNIFCIHIPLGQTQPTFKHSRVLTLRREPVETQDIESLYELVAHSVAQC